MFYAPKGEGGYRGPFLEITGHFSGTKSNNIETLWIVPAFNKGTNSRLRVKKSVALQLFKTLNWTLYVVALLLSEEVPLLTLFVHCFPKQYREILQ